MTDDLIQRITMKLASLSDIEGIVLGGSRARGTHTRDSDIDIGIYYRSSSLDLDAINHLAMELDDAHRSNLVNPPGSWGNWVNCGAWLIVEGCPVDLILRDIGRVKQIVKDSDRGIVTANYQTGHPHGFVSAMYRGELAVCKICHSSNEQFRDLKKQAEAYPLALQEGLIGLFLFEAGFSLMLAQKNVGSDDLSYVCGHCFRCISCLNQVIFALNREYCLNEKKAVRMIEGFKVKPGDYKNRIDRVISAISTDEEQTKSGLEILRGLVLEAELLTKARQ